MPRYGQRGGDGPTAGKTAIYYAAVDPATGERYRATRFYELADPVIRVWPRPGKKPYVTAGERRHSGPLGTRENGDKVLAATRES